MEAKIGLLQELVHTKESKKFKNEGSMQIEIPDGLHFFEGTEGDLSLAIVFLIQLGLIKA